MSATTSRRGSRESSSDICPVADLTIDFTPSYDVEQRVQAEIDRLQQLSIVVHVVGGRPNRSDIRLLLQARLQADLERIIDIQLLGRNCYHLEFESEEMVQKLLRIGCVQVRGLWLQFLRWFPDFDIDLLNSADSYRFAFSVMFPSLPKQWRPALKYIASMIGPVLDDEEEIDRFNANQMNLPIVRVLGSRDSILPSFIKLPALSENTSGRIQKVVYSGLPNQCFSCGVVGHLANECKVKNESVQNKKPTTQEDSWVNVTRGKHSFPSGDSKQKKWLPTGNKFITLSMPNREEKNHLEGVGDGQPSISFFEDVIDRDLQVIPLVCQDDSLREDNNKVTEQSLMITNVETTEESHWVVPKAIDIQSDVRMHSEFKGCMTRSRAKSMVVGDGNTCVNHDEEHTRLSIHKSIVKKYANKMVSKGLRISTQACKLKKSSGENKSKVKKQLHLTYG